MNKTSIALICFILFVALHSATIDLSGSTYCSCDSYTSKLSCNAASPCGWANNACGAVNCTQYTDTTTCNEVEACAMSSDEKTCGVFSNKCGDYSYADPTKCLSLDCLAGTPCGAKASTTSTKKCADITDATECDSVGCLYSASKCVKPNCADQKQAQCTTIRDDSPTSIQICSWTTACADANNTYTDPDCSVYTNGKYNYNTDSKACEVCTTSESYGYLAAAIGTLFLAF